MRLFIALGIVACLTFPAYATHTCDLYDDIHKRMEGYGYTISDVPTDDIPGLLAAIGYEHLAATRAFVFSEGTATVVGLEVNGCVLPPIYMTLPSPAAEHLSGRQPDGRVWA